jgi:hypothetical protein
LSEFLVSANSASTVNANSINFVNTATITAEVSAGPDGNANIAFTVIGGGGGISFTSSSTAPESPSAGDEWFDTESGALFKYITDADSSQWVELSSPNNWTTLGDVSSGGGGVAVVRNEFTGDGANTDYTLTTAPTDEAHTLVFLDNVYQSNAAYNVSSTTLSFTSAPDANSNIAVYIFSGGSGGTTTTESGFNPFLLAGM